MKQGNKIAKLKKHRHTYVRACIQLLFFLFFPAAFTTAFSGVKSIFTQIGLGEAVTLTRFLTVLLALCAFTIVFGRFFCGYACAFGTLGDAVRAGYVWLCKKCRKKPLTLKKSWCRPLSYLKYGILVALLLLCFCGVDSVISGWSPWEAFSLLRAGNFRFSGLLPGVVLLVAILVGMALCDRFFCRFLCPMGAVFSLLPVIPLFSVRRSRQNCAKGCAACKRVCPSDLEIPEDGAWETAGDCLQCQKCIHVCPKKNVHSGKGVVRGGAIWTTILRAVLLAALLVLAGL